MLVVQFEAGGSRHALPMRDVVEVVPWVRVRPAAGAPDWVAGYFSYRGTLTPAIDAGRLAGGEACQCRWNSRTILARVPGCRERCVGVLAERVTASRVSPPREGDRKVEGAWGLLVLEDNGLIQLVDLQRLLPPERLRGLFEPTTRDERGN
jgi:chemotaxis-related protein WspB